MILGSVGSGVTPLLDCSSRYWGYISQWNLLGYLALVFSAIEVDDVRDEGYVSMNEQDRYNDDLCG